MLDDREQRIPIRPHHKQGLKRLRVILNLAKDALGQEPDVVQELQPLALPLDRLNPHAPADRLQDDAKQCRRHHFRASLPTPMLMKLATFGRFESQPS